MLHDSTELRVSYISRDGKNAQIEDNFELWEFQCKDGTDVVVWSPDLISGVQLMRNHFKSPVTLDSGYRTFSHHKYIYQQLEQKVTLFSEHLNGRAADVVVTGVKPSDVADYAEEVGFGGIGRYDTFTHVDVGPRNRRWSG